MKSFVLLLALVFPFVSCGSSSDSGGGDDDLTIIIDNMAFETTELNALPGDTITVINDDDEDHTVTSESAQNAFDDSGDFDTGILEPGETDTFTIPFDASIGDSFFFYCDVHEATMVTPNGRIDII
jgi:plastocyanin